MSPVMALFAEGFSQLESLFHLERNVSVWLFTYEQNVTEMCCFFLVKITFVGNQIQSLLNLR